MMKKTLLPILLLVILVQPGNSQNSGYLGKHVGLGYQVSFFASPVFFNPAEGQPYEILWPSAKHTLFLNLTPGRKVNIDIHYSYFSQDAFFGVSDMYYYNPFGGYNTAQFVPDKKTQKVQTHFIDFSLNIFTRKFIAPLGNYLIFKAGMVTGGLKSGKMIVGTYSNYSTPIQRDTIYGKENYQGGRIGLGVGRRLMLSSNVFMNYSFVLHFFTADPYLWRASLDESYPRDYLGFWYGRTVRQLNRYEINFGLGYLLF